MVEGVEAIKTPNESLYPKTFEEYLKKHGEDRMIYRML